MNGLTNAGSAGGVGGVIQSGTFPTAGGITGYINLPAPAKAVIFSSTNHTTEGDWTPGSTYVILAGETSSSYGDFVALSADGTEISYSKAVAGDRYIALG